MFRYYIIPKKQLVSYAFLLGFQAQCRPVEPESQDLTLMSYLCGSVPEATIAELCENCF